MTPAKNLRFLDFPLGGFLINQGKHGYISAEAKFFSRLTGTIGDAVPYNPCQEPEVLGFPSLGSPYKSGASMVLFPPGAKFFSRLMGAIGDAVSYDPCQEPEVLGFPSWGIPYMLNNAE